MVNRINTFLLKRSSIPGKIPSLGQLLLGEIALNSADAMLYTSGTTANSILPIGWDRISRTGDTMSGALYGPTISATTYLNLPISIVNISNLFSTGLIDTGINVDSITYSNFFGEGAGYNALYASYSNLFGYQAGYNATNANDSNFIGQQAGYEATYSNDSNFLGTTAGYLASNAHNSNFIGNQAGYGATNASDSNFMGHYAGNGATNAYNSNFIGESAGHEAINAHQSNFMGNEAGAGAYNADFANFMGQLAGGFAVNATNSNFIGQQAGYNASDAQFSNFIGAYAGKNAISAGNSNFIGLNAGQNATNAIKSNFIGEDAGNGATEASNSNLFGYQAGLSFVNNNIGSNNIIIGTNISLPSGATNSINIGGVLFGSNTYSEIIGDPNILPQSNGKIGINVVNPSEALHVSGNTLINGNLTANTISATTYYNLPLDIKVTGSSFNNSTYDLTLTRNDGVILTSNLGILSSDMNVTGGTYNINTGIVTFTNNSGGTFNVTGFTSGMTDTYTTGGTVSSGTATFTKSNGGIYSVSGFATTFTGGTVNGGTLFTNGLSANTISATTYLNLPIDVRVTGGTYSSGTAVFSNNTGGTFSVSGLTTPFTGGTVTGATIFTNGLTANTFSATSINKVDYMVFNTGTTSAATVPGTVYFDNTEHALSYNTSINQGVTVNLGQQNYVRVFNNSGTDIQRGKALELLTAYSGLPAVTLAINRLDSSNIIGVSSEVIPNNSEGIAITNGIISNITLTGMSVGSLIYASDTIPGELADATKYFSFPLTARTNQIGYVIQTGETTGKLFLNINNENTVLSLTDLQRNVLEGNTISTGVFAFSGITLSTGNTFNIGKAQGWVVENVSDYLKPTVTYVNYSGQTGLTTPYLTSYTETYILLTTAATINLVYYYPTPQQRRENIYLGKLGHGNRTSLINAFNEPDLDVSPLSQVRDMFAPIKLINSGVVASPNGANMNFNTSEGTLYGLGINFINNPLNPSSIIVSGNSPTTFQYRTQTGGTASNTTTIIPGNYDLNGVITAIGAPAKQATNQRIYLLQNGQIRMQYGQTLYGDLTLAVAAAQVETFKTFANFRDNAILIGILSTRSDTTNLSDPLYAKFLFVSKFGELGGGTGGLSTTNLQQAYNNSSNPEIIINATLDGLSIQNGTGNADNITRLLEGSNAAGNVTSFIRADGYISGTTFQTNSTFLNNGGLTATTVSATTIKTPSFTANATGLSANTITATTYYNLPTDINVTGGTYSAGTAIFTNNTGGTFSVTGFSTSTGNGTTFTGGTVSGATIFTNGLTANTISATTYYNLPLDVYVTGSTLNPANYDFTLTRNDGVTITSNLGILSSDMTVTGGTYDINTGVVTFTNNTGGTFNVTGFTSGMTDTFTTGGTVSSGTATFTKSDGSTYSVSGFSVGNEYWSSGTGLNSVIQTGSNSLAGGEGALAGGSGNSANSKYSVVFGINSIANGSEILPVKTPKTVVSGITMTPSDPNYAQPSVVFYGVDVSIEWYDYFYGPYGSENSFVIDDGVGNTYTLYDYNLTTIYFDSTDTYIVDGNIPLTSYITISGSPYYNVPTIFQAPAFVFGSNSLVTGGNSIVLGSNISGTSDNTTYVDYFNIKRFINNNIIFGGNAGYGVTGVSNSNFFGQYAGWVATNAHDSNFFGPNAGFNAINAYNSNFMGYVAGIGATNANNSNFFGSYAGAYATNANNSNFFGSYAGDNATNAFQSNFFGPSAGLQATGANRSNFFGFSAGRNATGADNSNFIGRSAGFGATNASYSNFLGWDAGSTATGASYSNFMGSEAGYNAINAYQSNFMGYQSGWNANSASNSNLFGYRAGYSFTNNNIGSNNIIIGTNISLPSGTTNSINLGGVLFGINTYAITGGNPSIVAQTNGRIGINVVNPLEGLHVSGNTLINGNLTANTISATTYLNLPTGGGGTFTGGTVTGPTTFTNGLTANTISATTIEGGDLDFMMVSLFRTLYNY